MRGRGAAVQDREMDALRRTYGSDVEMLRLKLAEAHAQASRASGPARSQILDGAAELEEYMKCLARRRQQQGQGQQQQQGQQRPPAAAQQAGAAARLDYRSTLDAAMRHLPGEEKDCIAAATAAVAARGATMEATRPLPAQQQQQEQQGTSHSAGDAAGKRRQAEDHHAEDDVSEPGGRKVGPARPALQRHLSLQNETCTCARAQISISILAL
jgi:hypothetical protein